MQSYSQDLRDRVLRGLGRGERPSEIAKRFEVSRIWVYLVKKRFEQNGNRSSLPVGGNRVSRVAPFESIIREWIDKESDLTLAELCQRLEKELGISLKQPALWHQLNKWGLSFKKNPARQRAGERRRALGSKSLEKRSTQPEKRTTRLLG